MTLIYLNRPFIFFEIIIILLSSFLGCSDSKMTGTVDDTDTGIAATLYNPDYTPAVSAQIKVFTVNDTTRTAVLIKMTDNHGKYSLKGLSDGTYNVFAQKDAFVAFQDSVIILNDSAFIKDDTLEVPISLTAIVGLEPNHSPRNVTVQVLGTDMYSNVNEDGYFTIDKMGSGNFTFKLSTNLDSYTTTFKKITINANTPDTLPDTLWMIYNGIPVVLGMNIVYDTLGGVVNLRWNSTKFRDFEDYLIYRDDLDSVKLSSQPLASTTDTLFHDTIYHSNLLKGAFSFSDSNDYRYKYRVAVRNNSQIVGLTYKYLSVTAASPLKVNTAFAHKNFHLGKGIFTDSASVKDSVRFSFTISNPTRNLTKIWYTDLNTKFIIDSTNLTPAKIVFDTIYKQWDSIGVKRLKITVMDASGTHWNDTIIFKIIPDKPIIKIDDRSLSLNAESRLTASVSDQYGTIKKCEWKFGKNGQYKTTSSQTPETTLVIKDTLFSHLTYYIRAEDDDGNVSIDSANLTINIEWQKIDFPNNTFDTIFHILKYKNNLYAFTKNHGDTSTFLSPDGKLWKSSVNPALIPASVTIINDTLFYIDINQEVDWSKPEPRTAIKVNYSTDFLNWNSINIPISSPVLVNNFINTSFNNKLYFGSCKGPMLYSSVNGLNWTKESVVVPDFSSYPSSVQIGNRLYMASISYQSYDPSNLSLCYTEDFKTFHLINNYQRDFNKWNRVYAFEFLGKLCVAYDGLTYDAYDDSTGVKYDWVQFLDYDNEMYHCSTLPLAGKKHVCLSEAINFNDKIYLLYDNGTLWVSK